MSLARVIRPLILCLLAFLLPGAVSAADHSLVIDSANGPQRFTVELATTPEQMELGLMYRTSLAADAGMLFLYASERPVEFWMKNTLIPLDMLFIGADGHIRRIAERTVPLSLTPIASGDAVRAVLEVNGGTAQRLGIRPGDRVHYQGLDGGD
jgi:uncharacterized membrane protein (UPF0127 family)